MQKDKYIIVVVAIHIIMSWLKGVTMGKNELKMEDIVREDLNRFIYTHNNKKLIDSLAD